MFDTIIQRRHALSDGLGVVAVLFCFGDIAFSGDGS